ncbi:hypothetical protein C8Q76DRAFT_651469, partial [Earliella scabrosa]
MLTVELHDNPFVPPSSGRCIINELPSELLSHIFTLGWAPERDGADVEDDFEDVDDGDSDEGSYSSTSSASSAARGGGDGDDDEKARKLPFNVLVSHICARWRAVALANSLLWNHVSFVGPPPYERALTYLARAATAPLALRIDRTSEHDDDDDDGHSFESDYDVKEDEDNDPDLSIITGIMDVVLPHVEHMQALQIMVSFYPHMHRALEMMGACPSAPMLEVLQLYHYEDTDEHESLKWPDLREQSFKLFGGNIPKLTHVALWGVHVDWSREGSSYLSGLTDLELAYHARDVRPSFRDFFRILRSSPDLRTFTLCLSCPAGTPADWPTGVPYDEDESMDVDSTAPLVLSQLTDLVLAYLEPSYLLSLLPRFSLPSLTSLALDLEDDDYSDVLTYLSSPRSFPQPPPSPLSLRGPGVAGSPAAQRSRSLLSNLTSLKIASLPCNDALISEAYRQLEKVTALNLNMLYLGDPWFELLHPASVAAAGGGSASGARYEVLLPRLESLTTTGVDGQRMRELVEVRAKAGAPVKTVLMNQDDDVEDEDEVWLAQHLDRFEFFEGSDEEE